MTGNILSQPKDFTEQLASLGKSIGFCALAIGRASSAGKCAPDSITTGMKQLPDSLSYLLKNTDVRQNPGLILTNCCTIISGAISYYAPERNIPLDEGIVSIYAQGRDYHKVVKKRLLQLCPLINEYFPQASFRAITDSAPFYEQTFSIREGLGTAGKNGLVRFPKAGSMVFIGELLIDCDLIPGLEHLIILPQNTRKTPACSAKCSLCQNHCPTQARYKDGFDVEKCISYLTIENKDEIPESLRTLMGRHIFGCDECQRCCPYNKAPIYQQDIEFHSKFPENFFRIDRLLTLNEEEFRKEFAGTPILRPGWRGFMRNVIVAAGNMPFSEKRNQALKALIGIDPMLDEHIVWALKEIKVPFLQ